jgi:hypothetical protein
MICRIHAHTEIHLEAGGRSTGQRNRSGCWIGEETSGRLSEDASRTGGVKSLVHGSRKHCDGAAPTCRREFGEKQVDGDLARRWRGIEKGGGVEKAGRISVNKSTLAGNN